MRDLNWSVKVTTYRSVPQLWGVCINDTTLFLGTSFWDQVEEEENGKVVRYEMHGRSNPMELIKSDDGRFGQQRIREFIGWFEYYKNKRPLPTAF
jgi:hypothetical protein